MSRKVWLTFCLLFIMISSLASAEDNAPGVRCKIMAEGYYVREETDREWGVSLVGEIPSLCGAYLIIHDTQGNGVWHGVIPHGQYTEDKPFRVTLKPDGRAGDYKIVMVGNQRDYLGVTVPWTDLSKEVYGDGSFAIRDEKQRVKPYFKGPGGVEKIRLGAYKGHLRVLDTSGAVMADTKKQKLDVARYSNGLEFKPEAGKTYWIDRKCFYFRSYIPDTVYLAFEPDRWFKPDKALDEVKWWEIPVK